MSKCCVGMRRKRVARWTMYDAGKVWKGRCEDESLGYLVISNSRGKYVARCKEWDGKGLTVETERYDYRKNCEDESKETQQTERGRMIGAPSSLAEVLSLAPTYRTVPPTRRAKLMRDAGLQREMISKGCLDEEAHGRFGQDTESAAGGNTSVPTKRSNERNRSKGKVGQNLVFFERWVKETADRRKAGCGKGEDEDGKME
ncbi:hypothetical protein FISHEDRAFT_57899 [Fistulina hepatica ATCC 64428]|uniref:Uncharacterized protein n=1 Tax=Fistulina hepatica ATCC 64428 TaxID=1128425 RepID=A0A0D7AE64_9AGAR|nr:hypothetical protein FISHEDRAFT_57899 [Fistulina hepatica ATCC 64428]